jgi:nickel superoxide dismutase
MERTHDDRHDPGGADRLQCPEEALMSQVTRRLGRILAPTTVAHAHCDVPCGIYDPAGAQQAARTVARMVELIGEIDGSSTAVADRNKFTRCVAVKEQHAELVKHEVQVIWSDYFKPEHLAKNPDLHTKVWNVLKLASKNKQSVDAAAAAQLEAAVKEFADIFWSTKK